MRYRMKCKRDIKIDCINNICNGVENGGGMTMEHEHKLIASRRGGGLSGNVC